MADFLNVLMRISDIDGFSRNEYKRAKLPDFLFFGDEQEVDLSDFYGQTKRGKVRGLVKILRDYNFTADESSPIDIEVSLDPELLGHIFENLLASYNPETKTTARKATGSYYTPKEIVEFMVDESLIEYLKAKTNIEDEKLRRLLSYSDGPELTDEEKSKITKAVDSLKVIDPAVGSGAFPMGVLHKLVHVLNKIDPDNKVAVHSIKMIRPKVNIHTERWFQSAVKDFERGDYERAKDVFESILIVRSDHKGSKEYLQKIIFQLRNLNKIYLLFYNFLFP